MNSALFDLTSPTYTPKLNISFSPNYITNEHADSNFPSLEEVDPSKYIEYS